MGNANQSVADIYSGYTGVPSDEHIDKANDDIEAYEPPELDGGEGGGEPPDPESTEQGGDPA